MTLKRDWIPSPNYSSRGGSGVRLVIVHTAEGADTYKALGNYFASSSAGVSSHVGIDDTPGRVGEYVKRPNKAWTAGDANPYSVNVELCGFAAWTPADWQRHPQMLDNCAQWIAEECAYYGIPIRKLASGAAMGGTAGVCGHVDVSGPGGHWDPGPSFPWSRVIDAAQTGRPVYGPPQPPPDPHSRYPLAAVHSQIGDPLMPPEYLLKSDNPDSGGSGGLYGVWPGGLVRRIGDDERDHIRQVDPDIATIKVSQKDPGTRLWQMDEALRGFKNP